MFDRCVPFAMVEAVVRIVPFSMAGRILVDETDGSVLQMERQDIGTPSELGGGSKMIYSWDYVKIGDASHLAPDRDRFRLDRSERRNVARCRAVQERAALRSFGGHHV
jgi:hypothetical protein